ncbi:MAG: S1 RNA-binding domain-containing protein [Firmicutes bacterium]|jgi:S1 RNA binding domain protein|nr:S1 RNA-binding domain-containing protein [Bacillota bacterium]NLL88271.1 S1 RNA-binding domain-containing protein [Bacillota bacterium]HKM18355.1 S1 RNA-binding domain-containing protein [Limnochordia bacterium]
MSIDVGSIVEGKVTGITSFGAFVELENGKTGLVHISEVADTYVRDINDFLKEHDSVRVKVINITDGKIGLSIKQANPQPSDGGMYQSKARRRAASTASNFEERLARYLKESEERQQALRKSLDSKRGGRGAR